MCDKKQFTKKEAHTVLNRNRQMIGKKGSRGRKEQRAYQCPDCDFWHLTSMDEDTYEIVQVQISAKDEAKKLVDKSADQVYYALNAKIKEVNRRLNNLEGKMALIKPKESRIKRWLNGLFN